jgi:glycosyltransferase involved in cell wall biosynthesis
VETCAEMSRALLTAMREPARMRTMAEEARQLVEAEYDWNSLANRLEEVWLDAAGPLAVRRTAVKRAA